MFNKLPMVSPGFCGEDGGVKRILKRATGRCLTAALLSSLTIAGCVDDDGSDQVDFRPEDMPCPPCNVEANNLHLGLNTQLDPADIVDIHIEISNERASLSELINIGALAVPHDPETVTVVDDELCTIGPSGVTPTNATIMFELLDDIGGIYVVSDEIPIASTCP